jgi:TPP-dependent indolepyruvate ferredoxin oxidoreductase alpha subunit
MHAIGKNQLGLEEIGELTPDNVREALAGFGLTERAETPQRMDLPPRPPALCPGCPHRAFFFALNSFNQHIECEQRKMCRLRHM